MTISANQPYFMPYFPYWQLIHAADVFIMCDDYAFIKGGWINRNRILCNGNITYYRIDLEKQSYRKLISDIQMVELDVEKKLWTLQVNYRRTPYFQEGMSLMEHILNYHERNLVLFLRHSIEEMCNYLGINTRLMSTSQIEGNNALKGKERIFDFCHHMGATHYVNPIGGMKLYDSKEFEKQGIALAFIHSNVASHHPEDITFANGFSIVDAVMRHSREELHDLLNDYTLVDNEGNPVKSPFNT